MKDTRKTFCGKLFGKVEASMDKKTDKILGRREALGHTLEDAVQHIEEEIARLQNEKVEVEGMISTNAKKVEVLKMLNSKEEAPEEESTEEETGE